MRRWSLVLLALAEAVVAAPAHAEWLKAETAHFRVHGDVSEARIREQAAILEDYRNLLIGSTNVADDAPGAPLDIYLVNRISEAVPFGKVDSMVAGYYAATDGGTAAFVANSDLGLATLLHEYAHHFMLGARASAYPAWYREGFAEYFMTATFKPDRIEVGKINPMRGYTLGGGIWLPFEQLLAQSYRRGSPESAGMFYAQSWALTHYLFRTPGGPEKLDAYLAAINKGVDPVKAFEAHVDPDIKRFNKTLRGYLSSRQATYTISKRPRATPATVRVSRLPAAADDLLLPMVHLELFPLSDSTRNAATDVVTKAAARHPDDPLAARALALLAWRLGNEDAGARLDALLQAAPDDPSLLLWRSGTMPGTTPEAQSAALRLLVRAFKARPDDWRVLRAYAIRKGAHAGPLAKNDLDVLSEAWLLAPQVEGVALDYATALVHLDRFAAAARVLAPLASDPHNSDLASFAQRLRERAEAQDKDGYFAALMRTGDVEVADEGAGPASR